LGKLHTRYAPCLPALNSTTTCLHGIDGDALSPMRGRYMSDPGKVYEDAAIPGQWCLEWLDDDGGCELEFLTGRARSARPSPVTPEPQP
jgi:hypothetical protein